MVGRLPRLKSGWVLARLLLAMMGVLVSAQQMFALLSDGRTTPFRLGSVPGLALWFMIGPKASPVAALTSVPSLLVDLTLGIRTRTWLPFRCRTAGLWALILLICSCMTLSDRRTAWLLAVVPLVVDRCMTRASLWVATLRLDRFVLSSDMIGAVSACVTRMVRVTRLGPLTLMRSLLLGLGMWCIVFIMLCRVVSVRCSLGYSVATCDPQMLVIRILFSRRVLLCRLSFRPISDEGS